MDAVVKEGSLGSVLFKSRIITEIDIERALAEQNESGCRFGEALVKLCIVTQEDIDWALSNQLNIPYVRLKKDMIDPAAVALVPAELARRFSLVPLIRTGDELRIAIADPLNGAAIDALEKATGCSVSISVGLIREIREMLDQLYGNPAAQETLGFTSDSFSAEVLETINGDMGGGKLVDHLLLLVIRRNHASLSLQPTGEDVLVTVRLGGRTLEVGRIPEARYPEVLQRIRKISGIGASADNVAQGKIGFRSRNATVLFHVLLLRTVAGDYITFRRDQAASFPDNVPAFGLEPSQERALARLLTTRNGMLLFVMRDPLDRSRFLDFFLDQYDTSGKTVVMVGEGLGRGAKHFPRLALHEMRSADLATQLRAVLEHDPDILAIEEMLDGQSFLAASRAALRGKLVVAGVPWQGTGETLRHLFSFRHRNHFIVNIIKGIVVCTSVTTLCSHCREAIEPDAEELAVLPAAGPDTMYFSGAGCDHCDGTGLDGKRYLMEVIPFDKEINDLFSSAHDTGTLLQHFRSMGNTSTRAQGDELLAAGDISPEEYISSFIF